MKILSQPKFKPAKCEVCGTVFQVEDEDKINAQYRRTYIGIVDVELCGICPKCGYAQTSLEEEIKQ